MTDQQNPNFPVPEDWNGIDTLRWEPSSGHVYEIKRQHKWVASYYSPNWWSIIECGPILKSDDPHSARALCEKDWSEIGPES